MKILKPLSIIGFAFAFILSSCSIDKRVYFSGYHIEWKNSKQKNDEKDLILNNPINEVIADSKDKTSDITDSVEAQNEKTDNENQEDLLTSNEKSVPIVEKKKQFSELATALLLQKNQNVKLAKTVKGFSDKPANGKRKANGTRSSLLSVLGFAFSILGVLCSFMLLVFGFHLILALLIHSVLAALIFSILALALNSDLKGLAIAGLIISILSIFAISIIILMLYLGF